MKNRFAFPYIEFDQVLLADIMKQAYVEPVIFYNRYENLQSCLEELANEGKYRMSEFALNA